MSSQWFHFNIAVCHAKGGEIVFLSWLFGLLILFSPAPQSSCYYDVETPTNIIRMGSLDDVKRVLQLVYGVDYRNTPYGYDIISPAGCQ